MIKAPLANLRGLELLSEILRTGQLSSAADSLAIDVSTASRQLASLREVLNDPLFMRSGKALVPTERMLALAPHIEEILRSVSHLEDQQVFSPATAAGTIRILCYDNGLLNYVLPVLPRMASEAPLLNIEFGFIPAADQLLDELRRGNADLAIFPVPPRRKYLFSVDLKEQHYQLLMRKGHPLASPDAPITIESIKRCGQIVPSSLAIRPWTRLREAGVHSIVIPFFNTAPFFVVQTDFVMWIPSVTSAFWLKTGLFAVRDLPEDLSLSFSPKLIWNARSDREPLHQWVRSLIIAAQDEAQSEADQTP